MTLSPLKPPPPAPLRFPGWNTPAANTDVELPAVEAARRAALDTAKRLGWRGVIAGGDAAAAQGMGATLWGIARFGLPILTLGLIMEGDETSKPVPAEDLPMPKIDKDFFEKITLEDLKVQQQIAEISGNTWLAQILSHRIGELETQLGKNTETASAPLIGHHLQISASSSAASSASSVGLAKYVHGSNAQRQERHELFMYLLSHSKITENTLSWQDFRPIHSLADFNPDTQQRCPTVTHKQRQLIEMGTAMNWQKGPVLHAFMIGDHSDAWPDSAKVVQLPGGDRLLLQAHHRMAALIDLVRQGQLPPEWLDEIPVVLMRYHGDLSEAVIRQVLTLGIPLDWLELFP